MPRPAPRLAAGLALALGLAALPAPAQDRAGNDTPGDWVVTHHAHFGLWDSVCDELTGGPCDFADAAAEELYAVLKAGGEWRFHFSDRHGHVQDLAWDLGPFAAAAADFEAEAAARGLR